MASRSPRDRARDRRRPQGHPRRGREHGDDQEALRLDRRRVDRGEPALLPAAPVHRARDGGIHRRRHPLRRDDPPERRRRHPFPEVLSSKGAIPGIKVDTGAQDLALWPGEKVTEGLDGLRARLEEYRGLGARFAKWRAVITIGDGIPTDACIAANAHALARYAALCQEAGIVPIVEPEVLMDADNSLEVCQEVTTRTLHETFDALYDFASTSRGRCSSRTWSSPAREAPTRRAPRRSRRRRSTRSAASCRRPSPASSSSRAASPRCRRPRT